MKTDAYIGKIWSQQNAFKSIKLCLSSYLADLRHYIQKYLYFSTMDEVERRVSVHRLYKWFILVLRLPLVLLMLIIMFVTAKS